MKSRYLVAICSICILVCTLTICGCAGTSPAIINAADSGDINTIKKLTVEGRNISERDGNGATALIHAIWNKKTDVAKFLIEQGIDINAKDSNGYDALHYTIECGQLEIMSILIDKGADIESKDLSGMTPLFYALLNCQNYDAVKLLIKKGADINTKNVDNETVLDLALSSVNGNIVSELVKVGVRLWEPEKDKARLFFIGTELWDYAAVTVGSQRKRLNENKYIGLAFVDVNPGNHKITVSEVHTTKEEPTLFTNTVAGQTYYFKVTQNMKRRAWHYAGIKIDSFVVTPLNESEAKEEIKVCLNQKKL